MQLTSSEMAGIDILQILTKTAGCHLTALDYVLQQPGCSHLAVHLLLLNDCTLASDAVIEIYIVHCELSLALQSFSMFN